MSPQSMGLKLLPDFMFDRADHVRQRLLGVDAHDASARKGKAFDLADAVPNNHRIHVGLALRRSLWCHHQLNDKFRWKAMCKRIGCGLALAKPERYRSEAG